MRSTCLAAMLATALTGGSTALADDLVRFDFETGDLQGWMVVEGQFDRIVSDRDTYHNGGPYTSKQGKYYLSSVEQQPGKPSNDRMTGVVESPVFMLSGPEMSFLIGGGDYPTTYVALCTLDGKEFLQARGKRTEVMGRVRWKAPNLIGQKVFLRLVDHETRGWGHVTLDDFTAQGRIDPAATRQRFAPIQQRLGMRQFRELAKRHDFSALRLAIADLSRTFGDRYPRDNKFLTRADALEKRFSAAEKTFEAAAIGGLTRDLDLLWREALSANPLVSGQPILYVVRPQYQSHYHAIDTLFHTAEINPDRGCLHSTLFQGGGAIKTIDLAHGGRVKTLLEVPQGIARDPEVYFSGDKIIFALRRNAGEDYHIWEIAVDGSGLKQFTSAAGVSDFDPLYLPDESIVFASTREPQYNPTYASAYPDSLTGRVPLTNAELGRLSQLTGVPFSDQRSFASNQGPEVSFDRPELSSCTARLAANDPRRQEALAIIQSGKESLARRPRGDELAGFIPSETDLRREAKYAQRRQVELQNRAAIRDGRKTYDP